MGTVVFSLIEDADYCRSSTFTFARSFFLYFPPFLGGDLQKSNARVEGVGK